MKNIENTYYPTENGQPKLTYDEHKGVYSIDVTYRYEDGTKEVVNISGMRSEIVATVLSLPRKEEKAKPKANEVTGKLTPQVIIKPAQENI